MVDQEGEVMPPAYKRIRIEQVPQVPIMSEALQSTSTTLPLLMPRSSSDPSDVVMQDINNPPQK